MTPSEYQKAWQLLDAIHRAYSAYWDHIYRVSAHYGRQSFITFEQEMIMDKFYGDLIWQLKSTHDKQFNHNAIWCWWPYKDKQIGVNFTIVTTSANGGEVESGNR